MKIEQKKHFYNIDFLRFIFCLIVVYTHAIGFFCQKYDNEIFQLLKKKIYMGSIVAVSGFFIVSGFFLYQGCIKKPNIETSSFAINKLFRLWPMLLFSFVPLLFLPSFFNINDFLNLFFLNVGTGLVSGESHNSPSWFICVLFFLLVFYHFIIKTITIKRTVFICSIISFFCYIIINQTNDMYYAAFAYGNLLTKGMILGGGGISLGILIGIFVNKCPTLYNNFKMTVPFTFVEIIIFIYMIIFLVCKVSKVTNLAFWSILFIFLFLSFIYNIGFLAKILNCTFSKKLGEVTYSIFITHFPILYICNKYIPQYSVPLLDFSLTMIFCVFYGVVAHYIIEKNISKILTKYVRK